MARKVLNYFIWFYMFTIPFLMAYSISDNTIFSTARKIVLHHREMASPCTASSLLFLPSSSFSLSYLPLQAATPDLYTCKRIPDINLPASAPHSAAENASRGIDILGRYFRQFSKLLSTIKSSDWGAINIILPRGSLLPLLIAISNLNIATHVRFFEKHHDIFTIMEMPT